MCEIFSAPRPKRTPVLHFVRIVTLIVLLLALVPLVNGLWGAINQRYQVTATELQIRYGFRTVRLPLDQVNKVWVLERPTGGVRVFGTSTPGIKQGRWRFAETGDITLYATQLDRLTIIEAGAKRWGLSPADPEGFARAVAGRSPATFAPQGDPGRSALGMTLPLAMVALALGLTSYSLGLLTRFSRVLRYELGPEGLTIWTGWRPVRIAYQEVERVEVAAPKGSPLKLVGSQVDGLLWGSFSWAAAGPKLRLYATRVKPLVLLHMYGRTVGITPEEDERFVAAFRQRQG